MNARTFLIGLVPLSIVVACGGADFASPSSPKLAKSAVSAPIASVTAVSASVEPTQPSDADKARDGELAPKLEAIIDAFGNFDPHLSPDGKKFLFRSNRGGVAELYIASAGKPGEPATKIVAGPERVGDAEFTPDGKFILFSRDKGADENYRIYRVKFDGTELTELTPGESMHRDNALLPRKKPNTIVFSARRTSSPETMVYVGSVTTPGDARVLYTDSGPSFAQAVSPDGSHVLLVRFVSPTDQIVFDVDLAAGKSKRVYPPEGKSAGIGTAEWSADGKRIFIATNGGGEESLIMAIDATTYAEKARYVQDRPKTAQVFQVVVSPKGDRLAIAVDAGNKNDVRILDARTLKVTTDVKLPLGATFLGTFAEDGKHVSVTQSLPDMPPDPYLVNAQSGALEPLRDDKRPGLVDLSGLETTLASIRAHDGLTIPVHYYLPKVHDPNKRLPVIAHFHGGPAASSRVSWNWMARWFTSHGFAFVEPNIRGSTGFGRAYEMADNRDKRADAIKDLATINGWLRQQSWADPDRLVVRVEALEVSVADCDVMPRSG